ncbi:MAG: WD40 repeat domain-containing protein [Pirellulaceae bacterium]
MLQGHAGPVTSVCYSPRGDRLASTGLDGTLRCWDRATARSLAVIRDNDGPLRCAEFSPDGRRLAAAGDDAMLRIYDAATMQLLDTCSGSYWPLSSIAWSPQADRITAGSSDRVHGSTVVVWRTRGLRKIGSLSIGHYEIHGLVFTPNGRRIAIASGMPALVLWSSSELPFTELDELPSHAFHVHALEENTSPQLIRLLQRNAVRSVSASPNRQRLATADGNEVLLWEWRTGRVTGRLSDHRETVTAVEFAWSGELLASAAADGAVCIWHESSQRLIAKFDWELGALTDVAFSPDGQTAAAAAGCEILMWDLDD